MTGPSINRHRSRQDYETPWEFVHACENKFGKFAWDLAASSENKKAPGHLSLAVNSLTYHWETLEGLLFLNPPFANIEPWAHKCRWSAERGSRILFLVPASIGSLWFANYVNRHAMIYGLNPRLSFDGIAPFPKDCMLCSFWGGVSGFDVWKWR